MKTRRGILTWLLAGAVTAAVAACGKKGPPKRPDGSTGMKIDPDKLKKRQ